MTEFFHLFVWSTYYPSGGILDYVGSYPSLREAMAAAEKPDNACVAVQRDGKLVSVAEYDHAGWKIL